ncbi:MAG: hypothetical protein COB42_06905 [Sulfurimonas sp.]|nr:MAG: hypothetical protein COB42_06905 [Sulfurimonas sp.]
MNKKNTAVICLSPVNGGMELASVKLARILSKDTQIDFIAKKDSYIEKKSDNDFLTNGIKLHTITFDKYLSIHLIKSVRKILIQRDIKNIIFLGASEMRSLYFATLGLNINFIIRQGSKKTTKKKDFLHRLFYSNVNHFVGNCEYIKQNIIDILPVSKNADVRRIYSSLKLDTEINFKKETSCIDIVLVGRVHPFKGQFEAIQSCAVLFENSIDFSIKFLGDIQDEDYFNEIQIYLKKCEYKDSVEFVGYTNKVKEYLQKSDVFLFPSLGEGMSNAIIESLGYGLIPLIYDDTSSPEFKVLGFHIHLTKENNVDNLRKKLLYIGRNLKDEKLSVLKNVHLAQKVFAPSREQGDYLELLK